MTSPPAVQDAPSAERFRQKRYLFVKGLLPPPLLEYLKVYYGILLTNGRFGSDSQCPSSLSLGGDPALDAVLEWLRPRLEKLLGFTLAPTYSYTRVYAKGEELAPHLDRAACEISVTAAILIPKRAGPSVLHLRPPRGPEVKIEMSEGDGCVYAGTEVEHWRDEFRVNGYTQLFLHFIKRRGRHYPELVFDGRENLGALARKRPTNKRDKKRRIHQA